MPRARGIGAVALTFAAVGLTASATPATAAFTPLTITNVNCLPNGAGPDGTGTGTCNAAVTGGTGTYTYSWEPEPVFTSGSRARIPCMLDTYRNVILTVTDSGGATATFSAGFYCGAGA
jgi:hypothetical protein